MAQRNSKAERVKQYYQLAQDASIFVMAGLVPAIHVLQTMQMAWTYILTNRPNGTLYVGVTNDLLRRIHEHRSGTIQGFSKRYELKRLVYFEEHATMPLAITREKNMKRWPRAWKARLINERNRDWRDLYDELL
jgi:putative endonuclease